jgi:thiol-disulfide isomerase/thioredoxin
MLMRKVFIGIGGVLLSLAALAGTLYLINSPPRVPAVASPEVAAPTRPYVVKLHAQWCTVCLQTRDEWAQISKTYAGRVNLFVFDSTTESTMARSRDEAARLRLDQILASYEGASGVVLVINPRTLQVESEVAGNHPFESYRAVINSILAKST